MMKNLMVKIIVIESFEVIDNNYIHVRHVVSNNNLISQPGQLP